MRLFVAIDLPLEVKNELNNSIEIIKSKAIECKTVKSDKMHITLAFIGDVEEKLIPMIEDIISKSFDKKIPIAIGDFMEFEKNDGLIISRKPLVPSFLCEQVKELKKELHGIGVNIDQREFVPHITISRSTKFENGYDYKSNSFKKVEFIAEKIVLFNSVCDEYGARYINIFEKELQ